MLHDINIELVIVLCDLLFCLLCFFALLHIWRVAWSPWCCCSMAGVSNEDTLLQELISIKSLIVTI